MLHNYECLLQFEQSTLSLFWRLENPSYSIFIEREPRTVNRWVLRNSQTTTSMSLPLLTTPHTSHLQKENIVNSVKSESQIPMVPLTHIHSHTQYMLFIYKLSFNMEPVKGSSVPKPNEWPVFSTDHWMGRSLCPETGTSVRGKRSGLL